MRVFPLLFLGGCLVMPVYAADAQNWLSRLVKSDRQDFQGVFVYERNGSFSTHGIWHRIEPDGTVKERLLQLDGAAQEVVRVDGKTQCVSSALADQIEGRTWSSRPLDPKKLAEWYDMRVIGESRVADRQAVKLIVLPRDQHRYGFELNLDRETSIPLKSLMLNERGQLLERFQFTHLDTSAQPDRKLLEPGPGCRSVHASEVKEPAQVGWYSEWLPPGFDLNSVRERRSPASGETVTSLMYGDGLARFSVFLEPLRGALVEDARSQLGPTVAVSKRISTADGDMMVTVIGEIPLGTAERIALSMRAGEAKSSQ